MNLDENKRMNAKEEQKSRILKSNRDLQVAHKRCRFDNDFAPFFVVVTFWLIVMFLLVGDSKSLERLAFLGKFWGFPKQIWFFFEEMRFFLINLVSHRKFGFFFKYFVIASVSYWVSLKFIVPLIWWLVFSTPIWITPDSNAWTNRMAKFQWQWIARKRESERAKKEEGEKKVNMWTCAVKLQYVAFEISVIYCICNHFAKAMPSDRTSFGCGISIEARRGKKRASKCNIRSKYSFTIDWFT